MTSNPSQSKTMNDWADIWRQLGVNVIPADTRNKRPKVSWKEYQDDPISEQQHEQWKRFHFFDDGMAIILGKVWHNSTKKDLYLIGVDLDNKKAIDEFCTINGNKISIAKLAENVIVEQHLDEPNKAHIIFYAAKPFKKKSSDKASLSTELDADQIPAMEVKGCGEHGLLYCTPSVHKNGHNYQIIGTTEPGIYDHFEKHIDDICSKYGIPYLNGNNNKNKPLTVADLLKPGVKILAGHNRHEALMRIMESFIRKRTKRQSMDTVKEHCRNWNEKVCDPPLDDREFEKQWKAATEFIEKRIQEIATSLEQDKFSKDELETNFPELKDSVYYQINAKPKKFILAFKELRHLVEITAYSSARTDDKTGEVHITYSTLHNKIYLTCIPTKIVRHKNPISFLESIPKYSMSFINRNNEHLIFKHKTLAEILSELRHLGHVCNDGAEGALGSMIQAFIENKIIQENEDVEYVGFFTDKDRKIIASNIEIVNPIKSELNDALLFVEELRPYFEGRLELLATAIVWGIIAPAVFMLKDNNYFLKWLHLYGAANATKSNTGKIILAIDGHHNDPKFLLGTSSIDTVPRLGETVSHTTFPKLVDEVDLNDQDKKWLANCLKIAIESKIARTKFMSNRASEASAIPSLSPLIFTSNYPPPHDSGYMRKVIDRNFPQSESRKETDPVAIEFKEFLRVNLKRLQKLGNFRNWFIMNNQEIFLNEARLPPLDLGFNILSEAYKNTGRIMPEWLTFRIPETQLEESMEDNAVLVKRAFEQYIDDQVSRALPIWRLESGPNTNPELPKEISLRLVKLAQSNLLPDVKTLNRDYKVVVRRGILAELHKHISRDQCPNLRALADYMGGEYLKYGGNKVISVNYAQLNKYFDEIQEAKED